MKKGYELYQGLDEDLICKFKKCDTKGGLVLSTVNSDFVCEYCGKWQNMPMTAYYQPIVKKGLYK